jgi:hypothetical protein
MYSTLINVSSQRYKYYYKRIHVLSAIIYGITNFDISRYNITKIIDNNLINN